MHTDDYITLCFRKNIEKFKKTLNFILKHEFVYTVVKIKYNALFLCFLTEIFIKTIFVKIWYLIFFNLTFSYLFQIFLAAKFFYVYFWNRYTTYKFIFQKILVISLTKFLDLYFVLFILDIFGKFDISNCVYKNVQKCCQILKFTIVAHFNQ